MILETQPPDAVALETSAKETYYEFEIVLPDGKSQHVVISEEGLFCSAPTDALKLKLKAS